MDDLLPVPMQRVLKYPLLLKELVSETPPVSIVIIHYFPVYYFENKSFDFIERHMRSTTTWSEQEKQLKM